MGDRVTDWGPDIIQIDKDSSIPIYAQIVERVQTLVQVGNLKPGDRLPSIRSVAEHLRIDYNTVSRAYHDLDMAGTIRTARGVGTHIANGVDEEVIQRTRQTKLESTVSTVIADLLELGYSDDEISAAFERIISDVERKD